MIGYDFVKKYNTQTREIPQYKMNELAKKVEMSFVKAGDSYQNDDYYDSQEWMMEVTSSCDKEEAIDWMKYFMDKAVIYGKKEKNKDWKTKYLAAYDMYCYLVEEM